MRKGSPIDQPAHSEVLALLAEFATFGATTAGGVSRLACDKADGMARAHLVNWFKANGFEVLIDPIGNIFGQLNFNNSSDRTFLCGSHLDSQPHGGRFDGVLGVVTAMIVAKTLKSSFDRGEFKPLYGRLMVVAWTGEEGARFQPSLLGSSVFTGSLSLETALKSKDKDGVTVAHALSEIGYAGHDVVAKPAHYFEIHIEQGNKLASAKKTIGLVQGCWGAIKLLVTVHGRADHTGPTPMDIRKDALVAASHLVIRLNDLASRAGKNLHTSVGRMEIEPNSPNTVAHTVKLWVELRSDDKGVLSKAMAEFNASLGELPAVTGCTAEISMENRRPVVTFDRKSLGIIETAICKAGFETSRMFTVAGHDAIALQGICPTSLIFVPSKDGISHAPDEFTSEKDVIAGYEASLVAISALLLTPCCNHSVEVPHED